MSNHIARKQQVVRLRISEHRRAQANLAEAQSDLARLTNLSERLNRLRADLEVTRGLKSGNDLRMTGEMAARLDLAREALNAPVLAAAERRTELNRATVRAGACEDAAARMLETAQRADAHDAERRRDATHIHRPNALRMRLVNGEIS